MSESKTNKQKTLVTLPESGDKGFQERKKEKKKGLNNKIINVAGIRCKLFYCYIWVSSKAILCYSEDVSVKQMRRSSREKLQQFMIMLVLWKLLWCFLKCYNTGF